MTIVCGTDLWENAFQAVKASAAVAQRFRQPLKLVCVIDELGAELTVASEQNVLHDLGRRSMARWRASMNAARSLWFARAACSAS